MRLLLAAMLLIALRSAAAQPADCPTGPSMGPMLPLSLDLAGRRGVSAGTTGQALIAIPMAPPGIGCRDGRRPPSDVLHGEPGDLLRGPIPRVEVETR
jgi:hypothetical protein